MTRNTVPTRFRASAAALTVVLALAGLVGLSLAPGTATAANNLVVNGSFESNPGTSSYLTVSAGDSTTIPGWTVDTPSVYGGEGGSVDLVANSYWNAEDGNYSIDLAGTSGVPGGLYQDVPTTPGVQYSLTYWTAVNGDETPGNTHTLNVVVGGQTVATVQAAGVGRPLQWVQNTVAITATAATTRIEFDDVTPGDQDQGPALDNVSLTAAPDTISATPATIAPQTTGQQFSATVATFTDSYPSAPLGNFSATINWGDSQTSAGTITGGPGGTFTVSGTHTYAAHGTYPVGVTVNSVAGGTASISDSATVADAVTTCAGSGCSGTVTTPLQSIQISSPSTTGTILTTVDPSTGSFTCGDPFRHAPQVTTVTDTGLNANILYTVTFANKSAAGLWFVPFAVCYQAQTPFTDLFGKSVTTGLLPLCNPFPRPNRPVVAPCVQSISEQPLYLGNVVEKIVVPPGDPRYH